MRLLYLTADPGVPVLGHKGASIHVRELAEALSRAGVEVTVASPRVSPEGDALHPDVTLAAVTAVLPKEHADVDSLLDAVERQANAVTELAADLAVDAVYERFSLFSEAGVVAAGRLGLPHVLEVNAPLRAEASRFRTLPHPSLAAAIEARVFQATDAVLAVSAPLADLLVREGVRGEKIQVVPNGVSPEKFRSRPAAPTRRDFTVGFAGTLKPWHGVEVLVEAARAVIAEDPAIRFEIAGGGPLGDVVTGAGLPPSRWHWHGAVPHGDAIELMAGWHVGVAPYLPVADFYFSPLKVVEYMAAGLCTVASDLGQIRWLLGAGERGVLVPAGDPAALAVALLELSQDRERAVSLGRRGRGYTHTELTWDRNATRVLAAIADRLRKAAA